MRRVDKPIRPRRWSVSSVPTELIQPVARLQSAVAPVGRVRRPHDQRVPLPSPLRAEKAVGPQHRAQQRPSPVADQRPHALLVRVLNHHGTVRSQRCYRVVRLAPRDPADALSILAPNISVSTLFTTLLPQLYSLCLLCALVIASTR